MLLAVISERQMQDQKTIVFISYAREDADVARKIYARLQSVGLHPWLDTESLLPGQKWKTEIGKAIRSCSYFLALLSQRSVTKRGYVQKELKEALEILDEVPESSVFIIPIRLDGCSPAHEKLHELQRLDLFPNFDEGFTNLLRVLCPHLPESQYLEASVITMDFKMVPQVEVRFSLPRDSSRGVKVRAVIDTTASISSIPKATVQQLGPGLESCKVMILSRPTNIHLVGYVTDLQLAGRVFHGIEAVSTDQPFAVLGNDVLKHAIVLFDGPSRTFKLWFAEKHSAEEGIHIQSPYQMRHRQHLSGNR